jgi:hypothetical protein
MNYFDSNIISEPPNKNGVYRRPLYYTFIHIISGIIAFYYIWFGVFFIIYQFSQLAINKRFFIFQGRIENGNSLCHTRSKLEEFMIGILIGYIINKKNQILSKLL